MWGGSSGPHGPSGSGITIVILDLLGMLYFSQHRRRIEVHDIPTYYKEFFILF
jgi:hypothetical protein